MTVRIDVRGALTGCLVFGMLFQVIPALCADEPPKTAADEIDVRELGEQVDVLQVVADLKLTTKQVAQLATTAGLIEQKREELAKREKEILQRIKSPLLQMKEALVAGKPLPGSAKTLADSGLKELHELRQQAWSEFQYAVSAAVRLLTPRQVRSIRRSPEARQRAAQMVQLIRSSSEEKWAQVLPELTSELLEVRKIDKYADWAKAEQEKLADLTGEEREAAVKELDKQKEDEIAKIQAEVSRMLWSIRGADPRALTVAVNNLSSALRSDAEVQAQLSAMMARILDAPSAEAALKARLQHLGDSAGEDG